VTLAASDPLRRLHGPGEPPELVGEVASSAALPVTHAALASVSPGAPTVATGDAVVATATAGDVTGSDDPRCVSYALRYPVSSGVPDSSTGPISLLLGPVATVMRVLIVGATGFVGSRLTEALHSAGHDVVAFSRSASRAGFPDGVEMFEGDLEDPMSVEGLCEDIDVAYYLIHSLTAENFAELDRTYARRFRKLASAAGVDRVIYLSGISGDERNLSPHLASRREAESVLEGESFDLTVLRAAIIIGADSASFRIVDDLTDRLPVMTVPQWVRTPCQPISISDAVAYLVELLDAKETRGGIYDIGAPNVWSCESLLKLTAEQKGKRVQIVPVLVMSPALSSHWLRLTTDVQYASARPLVESMRNPVTVDSERNLQSIVPIEQTSVETAVQQALANG
jgi:dTDP-glucose 4,6-dehydratase